MDLLNRLRVAWSDYRQSLGRERGLERIANWVGRLAALNFVCFAGFTNYYGGDALGHGFTVAGKYFFQMGNRPIREVSAAVYEFSYWYALAMFIHIGLTLVLNLAHRWNERRHARRALESQAH